MKKIAFLAAVAAVALYSCGGSEVKPEFKDEVDSLAYELGVAQSEGLKQYMSMQLGVDSTQMDEFIKGMKEGALNESDPKKDAFYKGIEVGKQIQQMNKGLTNQVYGDDSTKSVKVGNLLAGIIAGLNGTANETAEVAGQKFEALLEPIRTKNLEKEFGDNKKAGEKYLADNAKKEGVVTLPSGVQYKVLTKGTGALPTDSSVVKVNYEGKLIDGTKFDSSYDRNQPLEVNMATPRVIPGWVEVLKLMPAGSVWEVTIPQEQAYGSQNQGQIKPFSTLIFKMEVLK
ncbi:MAG: FKBP-type peptidyl-prolyl cis-trans isomerase [Bacteroidaceae bacterium]|nr:FKBP-type peptidyl-prolyl cis-trans isomerase [Bacteroidaceae bacterium]MBR3531481.1 FKBP-type peptidyl-prolyl cis-trans isomerase [Bacteroidaceae bacterium]